MLAEVAFSLLLAAKSVLSATSRLLVNFAEIVSGCYLTTVDDSKDSFAVATISDGLYLESIVGNIIYRYTSCSRAMPSTSMRRLVKF